MKTLLDCTQISLKNVCLLAISYDLELLIDGDKCYLLISEVIYNDGSMINDNIISIGNIGVLEEKLRNIYPSVSIGEN